MGDARRFETPGADGAQEFESRVRERTADLLEINERLRQSEARSRALLRAVPDTIVRLSRDGTVIDAVAALGTSSIPPEPLVGRQLGASAPPELRERMLRAVEEAIDTGSTVELSFTFDAAGRSRDYEARLSPSPTDEVLMFVRDVTRQRELESELRRAERLASVGTLAAGVAHELNNPLGSILAAAEYALQIGDDPGSDAETAKLLERIGHEARRCGEVVKEILVFARSGESERGRHDLNEVARRACDRSREVAGDREVTLALDLGEAPCPVPMNPVEIEQVVFNLIQRAVEGAPAGGRVEIRTAPAAEGFRLGVRSPATEEVSNLGLSIARAVVLSHGGSIRIEGSPADGSEVLVDLPSEPRRGEARTPYVDDPAG